MSVAPTEHQYDPRMSNFDGKAWRESRDGLIPAVVIGTTLEWYDVFIYAQAAALVFPHLFFPKVDPAVGTIAAFATYGVGYIARPLGAIVFGHVGDRFGRRTALVSTLLLMGGATTLIGLLPTYQQVGLLAAVLLVILRLLQGLGAGAEYAGSFVMIGEMAPPRRRGFWTAVPGMGIYAGVVVSGIIASLAFSGTQQQLESIGWRVPFLLSIVLVIIGLVLRMRISESPVYRHLEEERETRALPFVEVFRRSPKRLFLAVLLTAPIGWNSYVTLTYGISYAAQHGYARSTAVLGPLIGSALAMLFVPLTGWLTDRLGRRPVYIVVSILGALLAFPFFMLINMRNEAAFFLAHISCVFGVYIVTGAQAAYLAELFPAEFRYTGVALSREISTAVLAAPAPAVASALYLATGGPWVTAAIMVACSLVCLGAVLVLPETRAMNMNYTADDLDRARMDRPVDVPETRISPVPPTVDAP